MADEFITLDDVLGAIIALQKSTDARLDGIQAEMRAGFEKATEERQAIRDVVDNDLAGQGQVMGLEGDIQEMKRTLRQHGKKLDAIAERLDRAKV